MCARSRMRGGGWGRTYHSRSRSQSGATPRAARPARPETSQARHAGPEVDSSPVANAEDRRPDSPQNGHQGQDERPADVWQAGTLEEPVRKREQSRRPERETERLHLNAFLKLVEPCEGA